MLRCIVYTSTASGVWTDDDVRMLQDRIGAKNAEAGITGRLLYRDGHFLQAIEGADSDVGCVFAAIAADPNHSDLVVLLDCPIVRRSYATDGVGSSVQYASTRDGTLEETTATALDDDGFGAWLRSGGAGNAVRCKTACKTFQIPGVNSVQ